MNKQAQIYEELISFGIIDPDSVLDELMTKKQEQILKKHPYAITPPSDKGGRWQTYFKGQNGVRKTLRAQTKEDLEKKIFQHYQAEMHLDNYTFEDLFEEWLKFKTTVTNSSNTIKRHRQHYNRYLVPSALYGKKLSRIDDFLLESECNRIVKENNMSRKEWYNVKTILNGMFDYAVRKHILEADPMENVQILVRYRQVVKKTGRTETYNSEELDNLNAYLDEKYKETGDTVFLAIKINFLLGLRVGELTALKWEDVEGKYLHILREEIRDQETNTTSVADHTKTNHDRYVTMVPKALEILDQIPRTGEYIFMRNGDRIRSRQINYVLEKYAERGGTITKSSHKMRKTFASRLNANGVPLDFIRETLGHASLTTTLGYIYNPLTEKETYELMAQAL